MIEITVAINRKTIHRLKALNVGVVKPDTKKRQLRIYELNCGCLLGHNRLKGALCLMIQMAGHAQMCKKLKVNSPNTK